MGEKELTRRMVDGLDVHQVNPMNVNYQNMKRRTLYYWSQVYLMRLPSGANYNDLRPTITINILAFELLPQDEPHAMYSIYNPKTHDRLNNDMELHFLELPKFVKGVQKPIREMTKMERWMAYFANRMNQSEKEELNRRLTILHNLTYNTRMAKANHVIVTAKYYVPCTDVNSFSCGIRGQYHEETGIVWKVDMEVNHTITVNHNVIHFDDLLSITPERQSLFEQVWED